MRNIILASHGELADGVRHSLDMITGMGKSVEVVSLKEDGDQIQFKADLSKKVEGLTGDILIICDLLGGTPANVAFELYRDRADIEIISGLSLPLAVAAVTSDESGAKLLQEAIENMVVIKGEKIDNIQVVTTKKVEFSSAAGFVPDDEILKGDNPIKIVNSRIDERLIHGQVAGIWSTSLDTQRIIVVNKEASEDNLQREALRMAAPASIRLSILSPKEAARGVNARRYGKQRVFLLFKTPKDVEDYVSSGGEIKKLTVGNMAFKEGKKKANDNVFVTDKEIEIFNKLNQNGMEIVARLVPNHTEENFMNQLKKMI